MLKIHDISIRGKLVVMQVFTSLLVLSIVFIVFILTDISDYKKRKVNSTINLAQVVGSNNISALDFQDNDAAEKILGELIKVSPDIVYAAISDKNDEPFAANARPGKDSTLIYSTVKNGRQVEFRNKHMLVKNKIISNNELLGYVYLEVELTELEAIKQSKYKLGSLLLLISIGFSVLIGSIIQPYISKRLLTLVNRMKEVSKIGDYSTPVTDKGHDEIGSLFAGFNDMMQQIRQNEKKKDDFIGIASHELKTPLTSIKGYLELLGDIEDRQPNKQYVEKARSNVNKLEHLIKDLLDVSKIQSGQLQLEINEFNLGELIDETIEAFQTGIHTHKIIREGDIYEPIMADRQRIEQVLVNLLSNAIKYSPGENKVIVRCKKTADKYLVQVRDFGIGIPEAEQLNVFKRFYRAKDMSVHISGFGLGLYICNDIVTRHNGKIWVHKEDKGSSFYFSLPLPKQAQQDKSNLLKTTVA